MLRFNSSFEPRLREFTILLTGRYWDCQFEWASHEGEARKAGLSDQSIETLRAGGSSLDPVFLAPLLTMMAAYGALFLAVWLTSIRTEITRRRVQTLRARQALEA